VEQYRRIVCHTTDTDDNNNQIVDMKLFKAIFAIKSRKKWSRDLVTFKKILKHGGAQV